MQRSTIIVERRIGKVVREVHRGGVTFSSQESPVPGFMRIIAEGMDIGVDANPDEIIIRIKRPVDL